MALAADQAFKDIIAEKEIRPSEPARIHDVNDGLYHVRARSIDGFGLEGLPSRQVRVRINRVRSIAADGFKGIWSDGVRFVLNPPPPAPPTEPPEVGEKRITIRWWNQEPGMVCHFQMAEDREFTNIRVDEKLTSCEISLDKPKSSGTYYIRVRGIDVDGFEGRFSPAQTFEVEKDPKELWSIALLLGTVLAILLP